MRGARRHRACALACARRRRGGVVGRPALDERDRRPVEREALSRIKGLVWRDVGEYRQNPDRLHEWLESLDADDLGKYKM